MRILNGSYHGFEPMKGRKVRSIGLTFFCPHISKKIIKIYDSILKIHWFISSIKNLNSLNYIFGASFATKRKRKREKVIDGLLIPWPILVGSEQVGGVWCGCIMVLHFGGGRKFWCENDPIYTQFSHHLKYETSYFFLFSFSFSFLSFFHIVSHYGEGWKFGWENGPIYPQFSHQNLSLWCVNECKRMYSCVNVNEHKQTLILGKKEKPRNEL